MKISPAVVLQMTSDGYSDQQIADQLRTDRATVTGIIDLHKSLAARGALPSTPPAKERPGVAKLLSWAQGHEAASVRRSAERVHTLLDALLVRHEAESELLTVTMEVVELEQRLAEARTRAAALKPGARPARPTVKRTYDPAVVRAWARQAGIACAPAGVVPKAVVEAWEQRERPAAP
ncbi:hypothetical protein [Streptomyces sp. TBY4]|uniref:hypothetical protein n=1 Tax=Streptomyces sp. TBY4 TaxID=2962030 RepID=UPI0020B6813B|nr:hypothetical protein [Streptomyces sp. TBY4]MCP3758188.1 hypothetical protein [Streptomyces sp. TBY4]